MTDAPRVLVAYGSKRGGTEGLAEMIGEALTAAGCDAVLVPAAEPADLTGVDAVIVAGSLYANRWNRQARRFVRRHAETLRELPVWLVCSGPLDDSAAQHDLPPTAQVADIADSVHAQGTKTFGGRLLPDATGFPAHAMAKTRAGDWRDHEAITAWVGDVVARLQPA
jgi:menaquinone-dependent protoporphyrinogen oxidase